MTTPTPENPDDPWRNVNGDRIAYEPGVPWHYLLVEAGPDLQAQLDRIERTITWQAAQNRWAAFTTNELASILRHIMYAPNALPVQIEAELARRKDAT